jgi:LysR family transcriptional regulator, glycine cleavage system transcriptional activator
MERLPLNALRALALVSEHRGVRAAARELGISHSAVSRHLKDLERWVGVTLLETGDGRALRLTGQGERLAQASRQALRGMEQALEGVREQRSRRSVSVSTTPSFAVRWLLPRLPGLQRAYPGLEVSVVVDQRLEEPDSFAADIAIRTGRGPWPGLAAHALMDECVYPVMSPALWQRTGRPCDPAELARLQLLHDRDPHASWQLWRQRYGPAALDVRRGARFASSDLVLRAAAQSLGVALARHRLVQEDLASGALLRPFAGQRVALGAAYWIVQPAASAPRAAVKTLLAWLRREADAQAFAR